MNLDHSQDSHKRRHGNNFDDDSVVREHLSAPRGSAARPTTTHSSFRQIIEIAQDHLASPTERLQRLEGLFLARMQQGSLSALEVAMTISKVAQLLSDTSPSRTPMSAANAAFIDTITTAALPLIDTFKAVDIAHTADALARLRLTKHPLLNPLALRATAIADTLTPHQIAMTSKAFSLLNKRDLQLFSSLADQAAKVSNEFAPQQIISTAWAFASLGISNQALTHILTTDTKRILSPHIAEQLADFAWALAKMKVVDHGCLTELVRATKKITRFSPTDISRIAGALSEMKQYAQGQDDQQLCDAVTELTQQEFQILSNKARSVMTKFKPENVAATAFAFAAAQIKDTELFQAMGDLAAKSLGCYNYDGLSKLAQAFAALQIKHTGLFAELSRTLAKSALHAAPHYVAKIAWSFAALNLHDRPALTTLAQHARKRANEYQPESVCLSAWAFSSLGMLDSQLVEALGGQLLKNHHKYTFDELVTTTHLLTQAGLKDTSLCEHVLSAVGSSETALSWEQLVDVATIVALTDSTRMSEVVAAESLDELRDNPAEWLRLYQALLCAEEAEPISKRDYLSLQYQPPTTPEMPAFEAAVSQWLHQTFCSDKPAISYQLTPAGCGVLLVEGSGFEPFVIRCESRQSGVVTSTSQAMSPGVAELHDRALKAHGCQVITIREREWATPMNKLQAAQTIEPLFSTLKAS
jgi:hypothetical protein